MRKALEDEQTGSRQGRGTEGTCAVAWPVTVPTVSAILYFHKRKLCLYSVPVSS